MSKINLVVMSDDLGMHPAINEGIVRAFTDGILTSSNVMAPCPAFKAGAELVRAHQIPVGMHATLTCDWDRYHWGPLTNAKSLCKRNGDLKNTHAELWASAQEPEVVRELQAQCEAIAAEGINPDHVECHMGNYLPFARAFAQVPPQFIRPLRTPCQPAQHVLPAFRWTSIFSTSASYGNFKRRKAFLKSKLEGLTPGYHLWVVHVAMDDPSLDKMCSAKWPPARWAREYRVLDMALVLDPEVRDWMEGNKINLTTIDQVPVTAAG
ncbi:MAG: ChbG/HpnK family deacetylase [Anaerolineae bacterium]